MNLRKWETLFGLCLQESKMPKLKTRKTLLKRIKVTKKGKLMKKLVGMGHLKVKTTVDRKARKSKLREQTNSGHQRKFRKLLAKHSRGI